MAKCSSSLTITVVSDGLTTWCQYAQNTSNTIAPTSGWSATMPSSVAGKFIWRREGTALSYNEVTSWGVAVCLTGATGATGSKGDTGVSAKSITISCGDMYWHYTGRGALTDPGQSIVLTANPINLTPALYAWYKDNVLITGATSPTYTVPSGETGTYRVKADGTYTASMTVGSIQDGTGEGIYLGVLATAPESLTLVPSTNSRYPGQRLVKGDYYVYNPGSGVTNYVYDGTNWQQPTGDQLGLFVTAMYDYLGLPSAQQSGVFYNAFARNLLALEAFIVALGSSRIHLIRDSSTGNTGCIYGGAYNADGTLSASGDAGFWLSETGEFRVKDIDATGTLSLYDDEGMVVFKNTRGSTGSRVHIDSAYGNDSYLVGDVVSSAGIGNTLATGELSFGGSVIGTRFASTRVDATIPLSEVHESIFSMNQAGYSEFLTIEFPFSCTININAYLGTYAITFYLFVYDGEVNASNQYSSDIVTLDRADRVTSYTNGFSYEKGHRITIMLTKYKTGNTGGDGTIIYTWQAGYTGALNNLYVWDSSNDLAGVMALSDHHRDSVSPLSITCNGVTFPSSSHLAYTYGPGLISTFANGDYECSATATRSLVLNGVAYTAVRNVVKTGASITFAMDSGVSVTITLTGYFAGTIQYDFTPVGYQAGIIVQNINAIGSVSKCGTAAHPFADGYFDRMHPTVVDATTLNGNLVGDSSGMHTGNVNVAGTAFKVWGAVAN